VDYIHSEDLLETKILSRATKEILLDCLYAVPLKKFNTWRHFPEFQTRQTPTRLPPNEAQRRVEPLNVGNEHHFNNAPMADEKTQRIQDALSSLVDALIPTIPDEDEADADERHDNAVDLARSILDRWALH